MILGMTLAAGVARADEPAPRVPPAVVLSENNVDILAYRDLRSALESSDTQKDANPEIVAWGWVPQLVFQKPEILAQGNISHENWITIFMSWLRFGLQNPSINTDLLAEQLLPFFVLRATTFWFSSEEMSPEETEREIKEQAQMLYIQFQNYLSEATL